MSSVPAILQYSSGSAAITWFSISHFSFPIPLAAALALAVLLLSAFILCDAYRRWLRTDLA